MTDAAAFARRAARLARREVALLGVVLVIAGSSWAFIAITEEVIERDTHAIDERIMLALRSPADRSDPLGPGWVEELGRDITALGGVGILTFITLIAVGYLALLGKVRASGFVAAAVASGIALSLALKQGFDRPRPDLVPHEAVVYTSSFPSGHSMMSALVYLTLGALLARLQPDHRLKAYVLGVAVLLTLGVGVSRVYLGVHWPSDVLAGWAAGAAWAAICWSGVLWLQRRRRIELNADTDTG